jgi:hypothetical protein
LKEAECSDRPEPRSNQVHQLRVYLDINTTTSPAKRVRSSANSGHLTVLGRAYEKGFHPLFKGKSARLASSGRNAVSHWGCP